MMAIGHAGITQAAPSWQNPCQWLVLMITASGHNPSHSNHHRISSTCTSQDDMTDAQHAGLHAVSADLWAPLMHSSARALATVSLAPRMEPDVSRHRMMGPSSAAGRISMRPVTLAGSLSSQPAAAGAQLSAPMLWLLITQQATSSQLCRAHHHDDACMVCSQKSSHAQYSACGVMTRISPR